MIYPLDLPLNLLQAINFNFLFPTPPFPTLPQVLDFLLPPNPPCSPHPSRCSTSCSPYARSPACKGGSVGCGGMLLGDPLRILQTSLQEWGEDHSRFFATLPPRGRPSCVPLPRPRGGAEGGCEAHERVAWLRLQQAGQEEGWIRRGGWIPGVEASRPPRRTRGSTTGSMGRMGR